MQASALGRWVVLAGAVLGLCACAARLHPYREREREVKAPPDNTDLAMRYSWPGQSVDPRWIFAAREQDIALKQGLPRGRRSSSAVSRGAASLQSGGFVALGPKPLGDPVNYPQYLSGGRVNALASDPLDPAVAYLGGDGSGVWKTTNCCSAATTWAPVTDQDDIASSAIGDIVISPHDHNTLYAGTGDLRFSNLSFGSAGLLKSTNAGTSWTVLGEEVFGPMYAPSANGFPQYQAISKVVIDPDNAGRLAVGTKTGVFFSSDDGASWTGPCYTNSYAAGPNAQRQDITALLASRTMPGQPARLYAAVGARGNATPAQPDLGNTGANGVYSATWPATGCPAWTLLDQGWPTGTGNGVPGTHVGRIELAQAPSRPQRLYALVADTDLTSPPLGVWRSDDAGTSWKRTCSGNACTPVGCDGFGAQMWYDAGISVDPHDPAIVYASGQDLLRSLNAGASFRNLTCGYADFDATVHVDHHARAFVGGDSQRLLIGTDGGVYYTANARQTPVPDFIPLNASLNTLELYSGDIGPDFATSEKPAISAGAQDNGSTGKVFEGSPIAPIAWDGYAPGGDGTFTQIEPIIGHRWYFAVAYGDLSYTYGENGLGDNIASLSSRWEGGSPNVERKSLLMPFQLYKFGEVDQPGSGCTSVDGCTHLMIGTYRLWETVVGGWPNTTWLVRTPDLTKNNLVLNGVNRSYINALSYAPTDPTLAVVGTNDGNVQRVYGMGFSYDGDCPDSGVGPACASVVNVTQGNVVLPLRPVLDVAFDPRDPRILYAGMGGFSLNSAGHPGHVFRLRCVDALCAGFQWDDRSGNLPDIPVNCLQPNPRMPQQVFAGTDWGLYFTDDINAATPVWQRFAGLPRMMIWDMAIDRGYSTLALFTRSRGAWAWALPDWPDPIFADGFE